MNLATICLNRPVFTIVLQSLLVLVGLMGYQRLELRDLPKMTVPVVSIETLYPGASQETIELTVTKPIEEAMATIAGLASLSSATKIGVSSLTLQFKANYDINVGLADVRDKVSSLTGLFPREVEAPRIGKADPNAEPTLFMTVSDPSRSVMSLTDYADTYLKPLLQQIEGVGQVQLWGAREFSVSVKPDPKKMAVRGITVQDITQAIRVNSNSIPGGEIKSNLVSYSLVPATRLTSVDEIRHVILKVATPADQPVNQVVRLQDVADVEVAPLDNSTYVHADGQSALIVAITPQSTANPIQVSAAVTQLLQQTGPSLPQGMTAEIIYDRAEAIKASIHNVYETLFEAIVLVVLVVFGFLASVRGTLIPIVTIPICLVAVFSLLYGLGYSLNNMTLLALVLAIGLVVDDAIVMLENVYRHIEQGMSRHQAAMLSCQEMTLPIIAMTLTLVAVYAPIALTTGITGSVFKEFAVTLAGTVLISGFVALTLAPMMCARALAKRMESNLYSLWLEQTMHCLRQHYETLLAFLLKYRQQVAAVFIVLALLGMSLVVVLPTELAPEEDIGAVLAVLIAPTNANENYLAQQTEQLEAIWQAVPEMKSYGVVGGVPDSNKAFSFLVLQPWQKRQRSQAAIKQSLFPKLQAISGALAFPFTPSPFPSSGDYPLELVIQMIGSYEELNTLANDLKNEIATHNHQILGLRTNLSLDTMQLKLTVHKDRLVDRQVDIQAVKDVITTLLGGATVAELESEAKTYDIRVRLAANRRQRIEQLQDLYVRNTSGQMIPLMTLLTIVPQVGPQNLPHFNRQRSVTLTGTLAPGYSQGEAVAYIQKAAQRVLADKAHTTWSGQTREFLDASGTLVVTYGLALVFIYLILAAQFESFRDPIIIMLTVPFSVVGAAVLLHLNGGTNNIYTQIGAVTLVGLVTKHGILITEFSNQLKRQGKSVSEAIIQAAGTRLRPILMTTGAMILGAIPLALASGAGAHARQQLGITIVGGMSLGTLFSLFIVPIAYSLLTREQQFPA